MTNRTEVVVNNHVLYGDSSTVKKDYYARSQCKSVRGVINF